MIEQMGGGGYGGGRGQGWGLRNGGGTSGMGGGMGIGVADKQVGGTYFLLQAILCVSYDRADTFIVY